MGLNPKLNSVVSITVFFRTKCLMYLEGMTSKVMWTRKNW